LVTYNPLTKTYSVYELKPNNGYDNAFLYALYKYAVPLDLAVADKTVMMGYDSIVDSYLKYTAPETPYTAQFGIKYTIEYRGLGAIYYTKQNSKPPKVPVLNPRDVFDIIMAAAGAKALQDWLNKNSPNLPKAGALAIDLLTELAIQYNAMLENPAIDVASIVNPITDLGSILDVSGDVLDYLMKTLIVTGTGVTAAGLSSIYEEAMLN